MTTHACPRCGYETNRVADFKKHLNRKKLCDPDIADVSLDEIKTHYYPTVVTLFDCKYCYKGFKTKHGCNNHMYSCKLAPLANASTSASTSPVTVSTQDLNKIKNDIRSQILSEIKELLSTGPNTINIIEKIDNAVINQVNNIDNHVENTDIDNHVENHINIVINNFGAERINHLFEDVEFMKSCFQKYEYGLHDFIVRKWFDPTHPENNCFKPFLDGMVKCFENDEWILKHVDDRFLYSVMNYVGDNYQSFLEKHPVFEKKFLDEFMKKIGVPLEWDLDHGEYKCETMPLDHKAKMIRERLYKMVAKNSFNKTKE